jgi:hypothetical protein
MMRSLSSSSSSSSRCNCTVDPIKIKFNKLENAAPR